MTKMKSIVLSICLASMTALGLTEEPAHADTFPKGFVNDRLNPPVQNPSTADGVTTFAIKDKICSKKDYGDGRGENDCHNGNVRGALSFNKDARLGEAIDYKFDLWVDPSFKYFGFSNNHAKGFLKYNLDSRLRIASWEGEYLHNFLYMLKADTNNGVSFLGNVCQPRADFGKWVSFEMKVLWSGSKKGWIEVLCDGKTIYSAKDVATNQNPHCYITNQCEPEKKKNPKRIHYIAGLVMAGFGPEWKQYGQTSQFTDIKPEGITIKMRNMSVSVMKN